MSSREVIDIFKDYQHELDRNADKKVSLYLSLGLGIAGMLGAIASDGKSKDDQPRNETGITHYSIYSRGDHPDDGLRGR